MKEPLGMWRTELLHPASVHFPIALLVFAILVELLALAVPRKRAALRSSALLASCSAAFSAWVAIYTGGMAEEVVNRVICDPTATKAHEEFAWWLSYIATLFAVVELAIYKGLHTRLSRIATYIASVVWIAILLSAAVLVLRTGHSGAALVFQQGAAVYHPSESCEEFE